MLQVTGIVGRADVLACIFFLLSFLAYHGWVRFNHSNSLDTGRSQILFRCNSRFNISRWISIYKSSHPGYTRTVNFPSYAKESSRLTSPGEKNSALAYYVLSNELRTTYTHTYTCTHTHIHLHSIYRKCRTPSCKLGKLTGCAYVKSVKRRLRSRRRDRLTPK